METNLSKRALEDMSASNEVRAQLQQSFVALKEYFAPSRREENASNPAQLVLFAEHAVKYGHSDVALECIQLYLSLNPPGNQFLIRAHLCHALVTAPSNSSEETELKECLEHILKAVAIAKKSECYFFLVYNASVLLWQVCRPFQKPGYRGFYSKALHTVVKALEEGKEKEHSWRLELLIGLVHSQVDAGLKEDAAKSCATAAHLARKHVPNKIVDVLKLQVYYQLGDAKMFEREIKSSPELSVINKLYKVKCAIHQQSPCSKEDLEQKLRRIFLLITTGNEGEIGRKSASLRRSGTLAPLPPSHSGKRMASVVSSTSGSRMPSVKKSGSLAPGSRTECCLTPPPTEDTKPSLLLELACVAVEQHLTALAMDCLGGLPSDLEDSQLVLLREFVHCQLMVQQLGTAEESYARSAVEVRLQAIGRMEEALTSSLRVGDPELIQHACVIIWNLSLPLLQHNLSHHLLKPLTAVADALEGISSLLHGLRCGIHSELAKICADQNRLQTASQQLDKAFSLDHDGEHRERLRHLQHRFQLRSQLYESPKSAEDRAAQIIEQTSSTNGNQQGDLSSVLVEAGDLLAPNCFTHVLARPTEDTPVPKEGSSQSLLFLEKGRKLRDYQLATHQVEEHAKALEHTNEKERCYLWADLAKTARKQEVWDVATAAAMFCLLYDDDRWTVQQQKQESHTKLHHQLTSSEQLPSSRFQRGSPPRADHSKGGFTKVPPAIRTTAGSEEAKEREGREMLRTLAEVHCLHAECLVYQLQQEGLGLGDTPTSGSIKTMDTEGAEQWKMYCEWVSTVSTDAHKSFLRASELGCTLGEPWLICNSATYLWNYSYHWIDQGRLSGLVDIFWPLLARIKQVQLQENDPTLVCRVCTVLGGGLVQKWMPTPTTNVTSGTTEGKTKGVGKHESRVQAASSKKGKGGGGDTQLLQVDPEAGPELKEALEVCEYGMAVCAGVPVSIRGGLLATWVQCKQLLQQQIATKTFGIEDESKDPDAHQCRAIVAVEMISRMGNRIWDFPMCPTLLEVFSVLCGCTWSSRLTELELWTRTASIALKQEEFEMVSKCAGKAVELGLSEVATQKKAKKKDRVECELLSLANSLMGQGLTATAAGNTAVSRRAMETFLTSARHGREAGSNHLVMEACRHYWNACLPLVGSVGERQLLQDPLSELLNLVASFRKKRGEKLPSLTEPSPETAPGETTTAAEQDLRLQVDMYGVVFQAYTDKCQWQEGLKAIEDAMWVTPRTIHRELAQHKLVFKSKMGKNVEGDMVRFQEEPEEFIASLWHKAASNATNPSEQLRAYQNAIDALQSPSHGWQKVAYLLEFSEWLYRHHFPVEDALDQLHWATDILLNMATEKDGGESSAQHKQTSSQQSLGAATDPNEPPPDATTNVRQLEALMRVYVMMVQLGGRVSRDHQNLCLSALGYCSVIWKQIFGTGKSVGCQLPKTVEDWATFVPPDELKEFIRSSTDDNTMNKCTITKPTLTVHYLHSLVHELTTLGLHPLTLPVLSLQLVLAECLLESRPLTQLIHMRIASVCLAMGLESAAEVHSKKVGSVILNPEDLAQSHEEMEQHKAKQELVEREESKRSTTLSPTKKVTVGRKTSSQEQRGQQDYGCLTDRVTLREVWVQQATILIKQGGYQSARELLHEARESAKTFGDSRTQVEALLGMASLSLSEKNATKAINLLLEAQGYSVTLSTWIEGIQLLSEAVSRHEDYRDQGDSVLEHSLRLLRSLGEQHKNESTKVEIAEALLKARLAECQIERLSFSHASNQILEHCDVFSESVKKLLVLGHRREAAVVLIQHAKTLRHLGQEDTDHRHQELLQALALYERAVVILQSVFENATTLCQNTEGVHLPIQRELVDAYLCQAELLMEIFSEESGGIRDTTTKHQEKSSVEKMIDDYVRESPMLSPTEQEWHNTARMSVEKSLAILSSAYDLSNNDNELKTKCVYASGHCLHLLSCHTSPDPQLQWRATGTGETMSLTGGHYSTLSTVMRKEESNQAEMAEGSSMDYLTQACQSLAQAVSLALQHGYHELAMRASLELVDCCGSFDSSTSSLYLSLHQSCAVSEELCSLLRRSQSDPSSSELAALLEQNTILRGLGHSSPQLLANTEQLKQYKCWERLSVDRNHLELLKNFPAHFRFVVLQHSPDRSRLYASYLIPPQPPPPAPKKGQPPPQIVPLEPVIAHVDVSAKTLDSLLGLMKDYHLSNGQKLLKSQLNQKQEDGAVMPEQLTDVLAAMEAYLSGVSEPIGNALRKESSDKELTVVLLADSRLLQLPLEALGFLGLETVHAVARDFSLQMLCHRMAKFTEDSDKPPESTKRGSEKYHPQPTSLLANVTNFKYILDPRNDINPDRPDSENPCSKILTQIQAFTKVTSKWDGIIGADHVISSGEWPPVLQECSGLLFFGSERCLAHYPPTQLAPLNLKDCSIAILMDLMQTTTSALLQSKADLQKSPVELQLEQPLETVMLFSLVGAGCVVANQWHTTVQTNLEKTNALITGLLSDSSSVGSLNWPRVRSDEKMDDGRSGGGSPTKEGDDVDTATRTIEPGLAYNCVIYGLPHVTLIAPAVP